RRLPRSLAAWLLLPGLVALVVVGTMYAAFSARATALTYQIATLRAEKTQLQLRQQLQAERLDQLQSAGQVAASATHLGMTPPPTWTVVTPNSAADPLTPVLVALRGG
ncbi:MAG: hypothetical protein ACRENV_08695, partial [Candidatus Dormibacteria bacterium]